MNILLELLVWHQGKGDEYRDRTLLKDMVEDFLKQRSEDKIIFRCKSLSDVKENIVSILGIFGNPNLQTKKDMIEIDNAAMEAFEYLSKLKPPTQ